MIRTALAMFKLILTTMSMLGLIQAVLEIYKLTLAALAMFKCMLATISALELILPVLEILNLC